MFKSTFNKAFLSTVAAAVVATNFSANLSHAEGNFGDFDSYISTTNSDGSTTSIRSRNGSDTYTRTVTKGGKVVSKKPVKKKRGTFITIFNPDGTSQTATTPTKRPDSATRHFPDGSTHTVLQPTKLRTAFATIFNPDGTSRTVTSPSKHRDSATRHFPDGSTHTVFHPSNPRSTFITIHNPDGTSHTIGEPSR